MTKAMRWGVSSLSIVGLVALGALGSFLGCSSDSTPAPATDTDSGAGDTPTDTNKDSGPKDSGPETDSIPTDVVPVEAGDADAPPPAPERRINVLFARPDEKLFACLGAFAPGTDPAATKAPAKALGPVGIPDPAAPTDATKYTAFPQGGVFPFVVNAGDLAGKSLDLFDVVGFFVPTNPLTATPASTCKDTWDSVRADPKHWVKISKGTVKKGDSWLLALTGCGSPAGGSPGECGGPTAGDTHDFILKQVQTSDPTFGTGTGAKFGSQFLDVTQFSPAATPSFQNVEVYLLPMNAPASPDAGPDADGGSPTPAGPPILIAGDRTGASGVKYKDIVDPATGVVLPGDPNEAIFLIARHGTDPRSCTPGAPTCPIIPLPAKPYLGIYGKIGGGFTGNQVIALMGGLGALTTKPPIIAFLPSKF